MSANGYLSKLQNLHAGLVLRRREDVLAQRIAELLPAHVSSLLDVGCGDGIISGSVAQSRQSMTVQGVEILDREHCAIPYSLFDGETLPFPDGEFDCVSFVDVLHHTDDPASLIREAARVSSRYVVIKDHVSGNRLDHGMLSFMDWVGNRSYGVRLNYNYLSEGRWREIFAAAGLGTAAKAPRLGLYPFPLSLVFERGLHFLTLLEKKGSVPPGL